jgi:hypothetical protein
MMKRAEHFFLDADEDHLKAYEIFRISWVECRKIERRERRVLLKKKIFLI